MKLIIMIVHATIVLLIVSQIATATEVMVHTLDKKSLQSTVHSSLESWLIVYHGADHNMNDFLEMASTKVSNYGISVGMVDCSKNMRLCQAESIRSLPSVNFFTEKPAYNPYSGKLYRGSDLYDGETLDMKSLEKFIVKRFPSSVISKVNTIEEFDSNLRIGLAVPTVVLFTEKSSPSLMFRTIAQRFKGDFKFMFVPIKASQDVSDKYKIATTVISVIQPQSDALINFDGEDLSSRADIVTWLSKFLTEVIPEVKNSADSSSSSEKTDEFDESNAVKYSSKDFDIDTLSTDNAWMVAILQKGDIPSIWSEASKSCVGHIQSAVIFCDTKNIVNNINKMKNEKDVNLLPVESDVPITGDSSIDDSTLSFGQKVCKKANNLPYLVTLKYGNVERKKLSNTKFKLDGIMMELKSHEKVFKILSESLPTSSVSVISENSLPQYVDEGLSKGLLSFILISSNSEVSTLFLNIALTYKNTAQFGFISNPSENLLRQSNIMKLPAVIALTPQTSEEAEINESQNQGGVGMRITHYDYQAFGPIKFFSLGMFVESVISQMNKFSQGNDNSSPRDILENSQTEIITIENEVDWSTHCGETYRGICMLGLLQPSSTSTSTSTSSGDNLEGSDIMTSSMKSLGKSGSAFRFLAVDGFCQQDFLRFFSVETHEIPTVVIYSPSKRRYQLLKGSFSETSIKDFALSIISGRLTTIPMSERPIISIKCADLPSQNENENSFQDSSESSEDAEEFLREIQKEEEAKAAQLKLEIKEEQMRLLEESKKKVKPKGNKKKKRKNVKNKKNEL